MAMLQTTMCFADQSKWTMGDTLEFNRQPSFWAKISPFPVLIACWLRGPILFATGIIVWKISGEKTQLPKIFLNNFGQRLEKKREISGNWWKAYPLIETLGVWYQPRLNKEGQGKTKEESFIHVLL